MKKSTTVSSSESAGSTGNRRRYATVFVVVTIAVVALGALLFLLPRQAGVVGKAYQPTQPGTFPSQGPKELRFATAEAAAAPGDQFTLPVHIKSDQALTQLDFELSLPAGIELLPSGCPTPALPCTVDTHTSLGSIGFPAGDDPTWSVFGTGAGISGTDVKVLTFHLRVLPSATISDTPITVSLSNGEMKYEVTSLASSLSASSKVTIVTACTDTDGDGYGQTGTELRACPTANQPDCDDTSSSVKPSASETCNGVDDDCDGSVDNGLTAPNNDNTLGVCHGTKICTGTNGFQNSYLVASTPVTFTSPDGLFEQDALYNSAGELCDFFDNDCDGAVNEELTGCNLGAAPSLVGAPPGNVFVDYNQDNALKDPQQLALFDRLLFNKMKNLYTGVCGVTGYPDCGSGQNPPSCGFSGLPPCGPNPFTAAIRIYLCSNGVYFLEALDAAGTPAGTATRFSPTEAKQPGIAIAALGNCQ